MTTASTFGAREHARAQAAAASFVVPAGPADATFAQRIPADGYATVVLGRGTRVRFTDPEGAACAHVLLLRAEAPWERLNVADTVKVPWQAYLSAGHPLLSDQGRVLATVVADTSGHHDALCGPTPIVRGKLINAAAKHSLSVRDIAPTVSFFRGVRVGPDGELTASGSAAAGASIDLLIQLPVTLLVVNSAHPLDARATTPLDVVAWPAVGDLACEWNTEPEYQRAVANTERAWKAAL